MQAATQHLITSAPTPGPRFVLITAAPETDVTAAAPIRIIGSEPRMRGQFCLTDR